MAKKVLGYTKLVWTCPRCATRNPGPHEFCNGCGGPQPENVRFEQPAEGELITDADELARAAAGPDKHCPFCGARNRGDARFCGACGGDLAEGKVRETGQVVGAFRAASEATRPCPACGTPNRLTVLRCTNCGTALPGEPASDKQAPGAPSPARRLPAPLLGGAVALGCVVVLALGFLLTRREQQIATVEQTHWERSIAVEAFLPVEHTDWEDDLPPEARDQTCELAYFVEQGEPAPIATEVCGTPYTIDEGSGFGQVVQDCSYRVYQMRCRYTLEEWTVARTAMSEGDDLSPAWPQPGLAEGEREGERAESYRVTFAAGDDRFSYAPGSASEFGLFAFGSRWTLTLNGLRGIVAVEPAP